MRETGTAGFWGYMQYRASLGVGIGRLFSNHTAPLAGTATWIYWLLELCVIGGIAISMAVSTARELFCARCQMWYRSQHLGSVDDAEQGQFLALVDSDNFKVAQEFLEQDYKQTPSLEVYFQRCPICELSPMILTVNRATENFRGGLISKELTRKPIAWAEYTELAKSTDWP